MISGSKFIKLFRNPLGVLSNRWLAMSEWIRFAVSNDYRAVDYWKYRHGKYGFDLRGVGDKTKSHNDNIKLLEQGKQVLLDLCSEANVVFDRSRVLDVGCGTGYFAQVLQENGVREYLGVDIVDTLFQGLYAKLPDFHFQRVDISSQPLHGTYDLVLAMDVLQHIVNEEKFAFALNNIKSHVASTGTIIISTHLGSYRRQGFYMVHRPLKVFEDAFTEFTLSKPRTYADSLVFSLRRKQ